MVIDDFQRWCGDETFAKFLRALQTTAKEKGRLTYWQEQTWNEFVAARGITVPCDLKAITTVLAQALETSPQLELVVPASFGADVSPFCKLLKGRLLKWAAERKEMGLDLNATLVVSCQQDDINDVSKVVHAAFFEDIEVKGVFIGANISGSVRSFPPNESVSGFTFIVSDGPPAERLSLGWSIQKREQEQPKATPRWWQFWRT